MKKKLLVAFLFALTLVFLSVSGNSTAYAESYTTYQEIHFDNDEEVTFIEFWSNSTIDKMIKDYFKNKMFGWEVFYTERKKHFSYVSEILYSVKNTGRSNIIHTFKYEESNEETVKRKVKGSLELEGSYAKKSKFKFGLENELEYTYEQTSKTKQSTTDSIKVTVAPNSELVIDVRGEGYFYQGVAKKSAFFITVKKGAFEYIVITTEYYSINMWSLEA